MNSIISKLTKRELEILKLIVLDFTNTDIGKHLKIELCTVKQRIRSMYQKLSLKNRTEAKILGEKALGMRAHKEVHISKHAIERMEKRLYYRLFIHCKNGKAIEDYLKQLAEEAYKHGAIIPNYGDAKGFKAQYRGIRYVFNHVEEGLILITVYKHNGKVISLEGAPA